LPRIATNDSWLRLALSVRDARLLLLLAGGAKATQQKDIAKAIVLAKNFTE
jgi:putative component of toxin-antitoxin plasmid stabilization module